MKHFGMSGIAAAVLAAAVSWAAGPVAADPVKDFYSGKRISLLISSGVGGGYDLYGRLVAAHMPKYIPGKPSIIARNQPGAGGMKVLNFAYNKGKSDGSLMFTLHVGLPLHQAMGRRGVRYDAGKIIGIGRVASGNSVTGVWHATGVKSIADARKKEVVVGATQPSSNSSVFPTAARNLLGAKIRVITGYKSGEEVMLALERGEVQGFGSFGLASMQSTRPQYLKENLIYPLVQWGLKREAVWPQVPLASELGKNETDRKALQILSAQMDIGRSYYLPPAVPGERVSALRAALKATVEDPAFLSAAKKAKAEIRYASGEATEAIISDVLNAPKAALMRLKEAMVRREGGNCQQYSSASACRKARKKKAGKGK